MEENKVTNEEIMELTNELTLRKHRFTQEDVATFFHNVSLRDYLGLNTVRKISKENSIYEGKTYLKELAERMQISIHQTSRMVQDLTRRGFLIWSHDGDGSDGTYVLLSEEGARKLDEQKNALEQFYGTVIRKFGKENMIELLHLMKQLDTVVSGEIESIEEGVYDEENQSELSEGSSTEE